MIKKIKIFTTFLILITSFSGYTLENRNDTIGRISAINVQQYTQQFIVGGQPSENDLIIISKSGVKTVINLRGDGEFNDFNEKAKVEALGMNYISIPITGASGINNKNLKLFSKAIVNQEQIFIHCASGNRVGAMFAVDAHFNQNKDLEEAITVGKKSGLTRLESTVRKVIINKKQHYE